MDYLEELGGTTGKKLEGLLEGFGGTTCRDFEGLDGRT
jgi:hypothetical protein